MKSLIWCLSYYSLAALALSMLLCCYDLAFWEIVHLLVVSIGMAWLLLKRTHILAGLSRSRSDAGLILLISAVHLFAFLKVTYIQDEDYSGFLFAIALVGVSLGGAWFSGSRFSFSRFDRVVLIGGGIAVTSSIITQLALGPESSLGGFLRWVGTLRILGIPMICLTISRLLRDEQSKNSGVRLLLIATIAFSITASIGIWRIGTAYYLYDRLIQRFRSSQYDMARAYASRLATEDPRLQIKLFSLENALYAMVRSATNIRDNLDAFAFIGDLADRNHLWGIAADAYRHISDQNPSYPAIHAKVGTSLYEKGLHVEALEALSGGIRQSRENTEEYLALGVALARMEQWVEADSILANAIELSGIDDRFRVLFPRGPGVVSLRLDFLVPYEYHSYLEKLTLYRIVKLLEFNGWKVLHPAMQIGLTGIATPADISAVSGGGNTYLKEQILVNGKDVSAHKRGYNVVVVDPQTGAVDVTENFDTWLLSREGNRLAGFLKSIPRGKIVAATINDEGSSALSGAARSALQEHVGVSHLPQAWWSHSFVGIKGSPSGTASEAIAAQNSLATVGILMANIPASAVANRSELETLLLRAAEDAPAKIAIYIPDLVSTATITVASR